MMRMQKTLRWGASFSCSKRLLVMAAFLLTACGGGGDESRLSNASSSAPKWVKDEFLPSAGYKNRCENPRVGRSPVTKDAYPDRPGSRLQENNFLRSWSNETYLWFDEIEDINPSLYSTSAYFELLKTNALTDRGSAKDKFHFEMPTESYEETFIAGESYGYGMEYSVVSSDLPRDFRVIYVHNGSLAHNNNIVRGSRIVEIDGVDLRYDTTSVGIATLNNGLFPKAGESHRFGIIRPGSSLTEYITLQAAKVELTPVTETKVLATAQGDVGYIAFHDHIVAAEQQLYRAVQQLANAKVSDLVLDLRYNTGGYLSVASQLAYMIAGADATHNKIFETMVFNRKSSEFNPVTGERLVPEPFYNTTSTGLALPTLNLSRVFILTGTDTCSASEAIMNGLRGIDVEVIQIGQTTCGKPYGFYGEDNCGSTYFTIQFRGENAKGFGGYGDGFAPSASDDGESQVLGCQVGDDLNHALGDINEARLAAALYYREHNQCPGATAVARIASEAPAALSAKRLLSSPATANKIMRRP